MSTEALLVVAPFLKHVGGPLLGPAMLAGAARRAGHSVQVLDLAADWLRQVSPDLAYSPHSAFVGDHDRPAQRLRELEDRFLQETTPRAPSTRARVLRDIAVAARASFEDILNMSQALSRGPWGQWIEEGLAAAGRPKLLGISVMYSGQVLWSLAIVNVARRIWGDLPTVWGGAHITALQEQIAFEPRYRVAGHGFVFGYAEQTWVDLLDAIAQDAPWPVEVVPAGRGRTPAARADDHGPPHFGFLERTEGTMLTLPAQASRGCAYARCAFCTYPAVEGRYRQVSGGSWRPVVEQAVALAARVSFKDSLLVPTLLVDIAHAIAGRTSWSACTKLHPGLDRTMLASLAASGLGTLEVGLETIHPLAQALVDKQQAPKLLASLLDAATATGVSIVVNAMTGFPHIDPREEEEALATVEQAIRCRPGLAARLEHHRFELERRSPMGLNPDRYGIEVVGAWPWSSVLDWRATQLTGFDRTYSAGSNTERPRDLIVPRRAWPR